MPRLLYFIRTSQAFSQPGLLLSIDETLRNCLSTVLNTDLDEIRWKQAILPIQKGGLGIPSAALTAPSAFLSSVYASANLVKQILCDSQKAHFVPLLTSEARRKWDDINSGADTPDDPNRQSIWSNVTLDFHRRDLLSIVSDKEKTRIECCSSPGSGDWLYAVPASSLGLKLDSEQTRISLSLRLGAPVSLPHQCVSSAVSDEFGIHALSCRRLTSRFARHTEVNQIILCAFKSANIPSMLEPSGLLRDDGKRPDGVTMTPWERGKCLA